jgi:hypothetical protein
MRTKLTWYIKRKLAMSNPSHAFIVNFGDFSSMQLIYEIDELILREKSFVRPWMPLAMVLSEQATDIFWAKFTYE